MIIFKNFFLHGVKIKAKDYRKGNFNITENKFGKGIVIDGGHKKGYAVYDFFIKQSAVYSMYALYAGMQSRPVEIYIDGILIKERALDRVTGGYYRRNLKHFKELEIYLKKGSHELKIQTQTVIPHIKFFEFSRKNILQAKPYSEEFLMAKKNIFSIFYRRIKANGFFNVFKKITLLKLKSYYYEILGIYEGRYAYKGPFHVQIDLTNNCNNNCIGCWCNSPLLEEKALSRENKKQELPLELAKDLISDIAGMGGKEIYFSGGGEPFMHPDIMEILSFAKSKNLICYVNTNFTLLNKEKINRIIYMGIEHLTVSVWAGTPEIYDITHPNKNKETFIKIKENLTYLNRTKKEVPYIKLYNVIFNLNYNQLYEMIDLAKQTRCESVEFTMIDTIPGKTDKLLLNSDQIKELQNLCHKISLEMDSNGCIDGVLLFKFDSFKRRISNSDNIMQAKYDKNIIDSIPCYIGWLFARILPDGNVNSCLKAHRIPTGNLYKETFKQIWNNKKQKYFRKKTKVYTKKDKFFRLIGNDPNTKQAGCYKSCDDIGRNMYMHEKIISLSMPEKIFFYIASKIAGTASRIKEFFKKDRFQKQAGKINKSYDLIIKGIKNSREAFKGPAHAVIDITNRCNFHCIGCWIHSPLIKNTEKNWIKKELNFEILKRLIDELSFLGAERIRYTGGGEPFIYPQIYDILKYTKKKDLITSISTNFSLLDKEKMKFIADLEIDELAVSLWAAGKETYKKTHPFSDDSDFFKIIDNLKYFNDIKSPKTKVTLCNVINNLNYKEIKDMYKLAKETNSESIYYTLIDTIEGSTDILKLNKEQALEAIKSGIDINIQNKNDNIKLEYFDGFLRRLNFADNSNSGYDRQAVNSIPCYAGWYFTRILADGSVAPCCRGVEKIMGNINKNKFSDIWFSKKYNEFRSKAKYLNKDHPYFKKIECYKECDNLMHNIQIHSMLNKR